MSRVKLISSRQPILAEVQELLRGGDPARSMVVFPGKRPSHFLRKALALERASGFIPPKVFSYDEFIPFLAEQLSGPRAPELNALDAASILYEIHSSVADRLGGAHFATFDQFLPLGFKLFDELEELQLAGASPAKIREEVGSLTFGNRHLLAEYFERFYSGLAAKSGETRSLRLRTVAARIAEIDFSAFDQLILAGFYSLTPTDRTIFKFLAGRDQTSFVFQEGPGIGAHLDALGFSVSTEKREESQMDLFGSAAGKTPERKTRPHVDLVRSSDTHGQVLALSAQLKALMDSGERLDERTVIVLPSADALFPVLHQTLPLLGEKGYNISLGFPLSRTPLYGLLRSLLDLVSSEEEGSVQAAAYIRLVLHPYIKNLRLEGRSDVSRVLFHAVEELLARRSATMLNLESLEGENKLFERVALGLSAEGAKVSPSMLKTHLQSVHARIIRPFLGVPTLEEFAGRISDVVVYINNESTAHLHPLFVRYAEKIMEIAAEVRSSGAAKRKFVDRGSYAAFLRSFFGPQTVPFPGTPLQGVQVLGLLETRGLSFDRVFVLDASDDILPGARGTEMLVPQGMREKLGLETFKDRERLIEYYFSALLGGAKEVHLYYSENNKQEKSRFIQRLLWDRQRQKGKSEAEAVATARYQIHLGNPDPAEKTKSREVIKYLKEFEFSATALDEYLACQLRFYYHHVLGLREKEEVGEEIEQLDVGKLVHRVLRRFFEPLKEKSLSVEDLSDEKMEEIVNSEVEMIFGEHVKGSALLFRQQTAGKLKEFLSDYQKKMLEHQSVRITGVEHEVSIVRNDHHFTGRIDRIEERGNTTFILDYKIRQDDTPYKVTWKKFRVEDRETWSEAIGSLQLPMYSLLYSEESGKSRGEIVPAYLFLGRNYLDKSIETGLSKDGIVTDEMHANLHKVILGLAEEIKDPQVPFHPTDDIKRECPGCPYQTLCGTQWAREGRW